MSVVLDASALLAWLQLEPGAELVKAELSGAIMSTVNWAEVIKKVSGNGENEPGLRGSLEILGLTLVPFSAIQAEVAGGLRDQTRALGLSLGDRACLALGLDREATIYTSDRAWKNLEPGVQIKVIR